MWLIYTLNFSAETVSLLVTCCLVLHIQTNFHGHLPRTRWRTDKHHRRYNSRNRWHERFETGCGMLDDKRVRAVLFITELPPLVSVSRGFQYGITNNGNDFDTGSCYCNGPPQLTESSHSSDHYHFRRYSIGRIKACSPDGLA